MTTDIEFENQVLSVGSEFLPAVARKARDGEELTEAEQVAYTDWLEAQRSE